MSTSACSRPAHAVLAFGHSFPASKVAETVRWHGIEVAAVSVRYHAVGEKPSSATRDAMVPGASHAPVAAESSDTDAEDVNAEIPDEFHDVFGHSMTNQVENLGPVEPMKTLAGQYAHNPNLVRQFDELAASFGAWRPVRGDGNCYYRAVLFAWLERCLALGALDSLCNFSAMLKSHRRVPGLDASVRLCRRLVKGWMKQRERCTSEMKVRVLLNAVSQEFSKVRSDRAFILCLRHLCARYLCQHAQEPVEAGAKNGPGGNNTIFTYDAWVTSFSGSKSIEEYCETDVYVMDVDAADLVQHVCPRVLRTVVRICMVDRQTAHANYIDYPLNRDAALVSSASQLATSSGLADAQPEIFLLLKPGHYDILIKQDDGVGKLLCSEIEPPSAGRVVPDASFLPDNARARQQSDARLRNTHRVMAEVMGAFHAALQCLEEKVVQQLEAQKKRLGSIDESLFEGTLTSVLDPLRDALARYRSMTGDNRDGQEFKVGSVNSLHLLLPKLAALLQQGRPTPQDAGVLQPPLAGQPHDAPRGYPQVSSIGPGAALQQKRAIPIDVQAVQVESAPPAPLHSMRVSSLVAATKPDPQVVMSSLVGAAKPDPQAAVAKLVPHLAAPAPATECCFCMVRGAIVQASCGCAYHADCLKEYADMEGGQDLACHIHSKPFGASFVAQHLPGYGSGSGAVAVMASAPIPSAAEHVVEGVTQSKVEASAQSSALSQAQPIGLETQVQLSALSGSGNTPAPQAFMQPDILDNAPPIGATTQKLLAPSTGRSYIRGGLLSVPGAAASGAGRPSTLRREIAPSGPLGTARGGLRVPASGNLGAALGVPCVLCFGEDGIFKTLHCGYKAHVKCLLDFWSERVVTLCRLTDIRCPAEVAGCNEILGEGDLRGVVSADDLAAAEASVQDVDAQNRDLIDELKRQCEEYRPMFQCAICLVEHEVEGCCTLPCQHRFCFESLQYHFDIIVRERRLNKLSCPVDGCGHSLRSEECIHIFQQCLSDETYHKLLEFLTRDDPHIYDCPHLGCEERVFMDDGDDCGDLACPQGHRFCGLCEIGPHPGISCDDHQERVDRQKKEEEARKDQDDAWRNAMALGWKPCPMRCTYGGGYKAEEECDHVTCECGFEFCWDCGADRRITLHHDNRWHKPACRYHTRPAEVSEPPRFVQGCPECQRMPNGVCCPFSPDDGYPESYIGRRRSRREQPRQ